MGSDFYSEEDTFSSEQPFLFTDGRLRRGRVEVCVEGAYRTICDDSWDNNAASVVCRQLGFSPYGERVRVFCCVMNVSCFAHCSGAVGVKSGLYGDSSIPVALQDVQCSGSEENIFNCNKTVPDEPLSCQNVEVECQGMWTCIPATHTHHPLSRIALSTPEANCSDGEVRLVGGKEEGIGRVEVCLNRAWGTVCGIGVGFGAEDAQVVCRELGLLQGKG